MSWPVTEKALEMAWPGSGLPNTTKFAVRPWREDDERGDGGQRRRAGHARPATSTAAPHATTTQAKASQIASLRVSAASPSRTPMAMTRGSVQRAPRGSRATRAMSRQAPRARTAKTIVESVRAEKNTSWR